MLSTREYIALIDILSSHKSPYAPFLISLLKELNEDMAKVLRILSMGISGNKKVFPVAVYNTLIYSIKEAIILSNYKNFILEDGFISLTNMAKTERFSLAYVDRQTIGRVFKKYNIQYTRR